MAALYAVFVSAPAGWGVAAWCGIGLVSAAAILVGTWRHAPVRRAPWWLLSAAILAMTLGDLAYGTSTPRFRGPPPAIADVCYFVMFPLVMASLAALTRASMVLGDRARLLGLLTFTCAAAMLSWVFLVGPSLSARHLTNGDRSALAAYVLGDLLVLVVTVRLVLAARRSVTVILLALGAGGLLAANLAYAWAQVGEGWQPREPATLGYLLLYVGWGASALHPSMADLTAPPDVRPARPEGRWTLRVRVWLWIPPATLLLETVTGRIRDGVVIAVSAVVMSEIVITQLADVVTRHRLSIARERGLREASCALVAAADLESVVDAVQAAVHRLVPPGVEHVVLVSVGGAADEATGDATSSPTSPPTSPAASPATGPAREAPRLAAEATHLVPAPPAGRGSRLAQTRLLHPRLHDELGHFATTLVCPLAPGGQTRSAAGILFVAAPDRVLTAMRDAVEVLAAQATLALERIALDDVVNRRDGDRYLSMVVSNATDAMLITDADDRIRYSSPSLVSLLGVEPSANSTLGELVDPDDRDQITQTRLRAEEVRGPEGVQDVWHVRRPDGTRVLIDVGYRDLRRDRMVRGFVITLQDITERRAHEQERIRRALRHSGGWQNRRSSLSRFR